MLASVNVFFILILIHINSFNSCSVKRFLHLIDFVPKTIRFLYQEKHEHSLASASVSGDAAGCEKVSNFSFISCLKPNSINHFLNRTVWFLLWNRSMCRLSEGYVSSLQGLVGSRGRCRHHFKGTDKRWESDIISVKKRSTCNFRLHPVQVQIWCSFLLN